jgi:hypothetical protein
MSFHIVTEPIDAWPLPDTRNRSYPPFTATYRQTELLLHRELGQIGARGPVVMQVVTRNGANDLRRDGALRAQAKIEHPGVRLSFESKHGPLTYATDAFDGTYSRPAWQQNLRAIALGLEALRKVDRYGIARSGEQYRGWRAIEAAGSDSPMQVLTRWAGPVFGDRYRDDLPKLARFARVGAHPDRNGGDHTGSDEVLAAIKALGLDS